MVYRCLLQIVHADFDEEDDTFLLKVCIARAGCMPKKPKPKTPPPKVTPKKETPPTPKPAPTPAKSKPSTNFKTLASVATKLQPPKPKVETKQEKLKKRDPFFETEEYEVRISAWICCLWWGWRKWKTVGESKSSPVIIREGSPDGASRLWCLYPAIIINLVLLFRWTQYYTYIQQQQQLQYFIWFSVVLHKE